MPVAPPVTMATLSLRRSAVGSIDRRLLLRDGHPGDHAVPVDSRCLAADDGIIKMSEQGELQIARKAEWPEKRVSEADGFSKGHRIGGLMEQAVNDGVRPVDEVAACVDELGDLGAPHHGIVAGEEQIKIERVEQLQRRSIPIDGK